MSSHALTLLGFSPTGTGRRVLQAVALGFGAPGARYLEMSPRATGAHGYRIDPLGVPVLQDAEAVAVIAPVYVGRIPEIVVSYLRVLGATSRERGLPAIPALGIVIYGNRAYDDALLELSDELTDAGFDVLAAGAFIGEHSYSTDELPVAAGRPNRDDRLAAEALGERFRGMVAAHSEAAALHMVCPPSETAKVVGTEASVGTASAGTEEGSMRRIRSEQVRMRLRIPGNRPYRDRIPPGGQAPVTDLDECILCGACESACPLGIVSVTDHVETDVSECIYCCACVKECPNGSRQINSEGVLRFSELLAANHSEPLEPSLFLPQE